MRRLKSCRISEYRADYEPMPLGDAVICVTQHSNSRQPKGQSQVRDGFARPACLVLATTLKNDVWAGSAVAVGPYIRVEVAFGLVRTAVACAALGRSSVGMPPFSLARTGAACVWK